MRHFAFFGEKLIFVSLARMKKKKRFNSNRLIEIVIKYELRFIYTARVSRVTRNGRCDSRSTNKSCTSASDNNIDIALEDTRLNPRVSRDFALRLLISVRQKSMPRIFSKYPEYYYIRFSTILSSESSGFNGVRSGGGAENDCI